MTRRIRALGAALCVMTAACGHYGPPVRRAPAREEAVKPTAAPGALEPAKSPEPEHPEHDE